MNYDVLVEVGIHLDQDLDTHKSNNSLQVKRSHSQKNFILFTLGMEEKKIRMLKKLSSYYQLTAINDHFLPNQSKNKVNLNRNVYIMISLIIKSILVYANNYAAKIRYFSDSIHARTLVKRGVASSNNPLIFKINTNYRIANEIVINFNTFFRKSKGYIPDLFHLEGGLFYSKEELTQYPLLKSKTKNIFDKLSKPKLHSEIVYFSKEFIWITYLKLYFGKLLYAGKRYYSEGVYKGSGCYLALNFILYSANILGFVWLKLYPHYNNKGRYSVYNHDKYNQNYARYIDEKNDDYEFYLNKYLINKIILLFILVRNNLLKYSLQKNGYKFIN